MNHEGVSSHIIELLDLGFTVEEARQLVLLRKKCEITGLLQEETALDNRLLFARYLLDHGQINEAWER